MLFQVLPDWLPGEAPVLLRRDLAVRTQGKTQHVALRDRAQFLVHFRHAARNRDIPIHQNQYLSGFERAPGRRTGPHDAQKKPARGYWKAGRRDRAKKSIDPRFVMSLRQNGPPFQRAFPWTASSALAIGCRSQRACALRGSII